MRLRTMQAGPVMQMPIFILMFLAPVYVPLALIAGWVHTVATYNPVTAMLEASRGFIAGEPTKVGDQRRLPRRDVRPRARTGRAAACAPPRPPASRIPAVEARAVRVSSRPWTSNRAST